MLSFDHPIEKVNRLSYGFTEGPAYDRRGHVYFVDYARSLIVRHNIQTGTFEVWATATEHANGGAFLFDGTLVSCRGGARDVVIWSPNGVVDRVLAFEYQGRRFNAPNDLVISRIGWIYFTDPDFDQRTSMPDAVYALSPQGMVHRIDENILRPNGIMLNPDETVLLINGTLQREVIAYDVAANGALSNRRIFATVSDPDRERYPGYPNRWFGCDGMAVDVEGHVYVTCGAGLQAFDAGGRLVATLTIPEKPTNVCFAGADTRTLFVTAQTSLYRLQAPIPGVVFQQSLKGSPGTKPR